MVSLKNKNPVIVVTNEFFPTRGGIATFTEEMARGAAAIGRNVEVWAPVTAATLHEKDWPFSVRRMPLRGTHGWGCQFRLAQHFLRNRKTLQNATVYLPEPGPMLALMLLQFFNLVKTNELVLTFHGSEILRFASKPHRKLLAQKLIRKTERISVLSNYTHQLLCEKFPEACNKTIITPGALRSDFLAEKSSSKESKGRVSILTVGRLHPRKGQLFILEALRQLPDAIREKIEYWMIGPSRSETYTKLLQERAAACDFPVKFLGDVTDDEVEKAYNDADIFAMTSIQQHRSVEGFGLVYLEASAHGLPVIAHSVGGVTEAVVHESTGLLVPPVNQTALTGAFLRLISNPDLRKQYGENGRIWARRNCWRRSAGALLGESVCS